MGINSYKFDNIVTKISITPFIQDTDDHNMIFQLIESASIDLIHFDSLNHFHTNKMSQ